MLSMEFEELLYKITADAVQILIEALAASETEYINLDFAPLAKALQKKDVNDPNILKKLFSGDIETLEIFTELEPTQKHELLHHVISICVMGIPDISLLFPEAIKIASILGFHQKNVTKTSFDHPFDRSVLEKLQLTSSTEPLFHSPFLSAIDHVINEAGNPKTLLNRLSLKNRKTGKDIEDFECMIRAFSDLEPNIQRKMENDYLEVYTLIHMGIDIHNICGTMSHPINSNEPLPKTTLQFAMDNGLDKIVSLLILYGAHKNTNPEVLSALEYAILLNRPDYVETLYEIDPAYCQTTFAGPSGLDKKLTISSLYADLPNKNMLDMFELLEKRSQPVEALLDEKKEEPEICDIQDQETSTFKLSAPAIHFVYSANSPVSSDNLTALNSTGPFDADNPEIYNRKTSRNRCSIS